MALKGPHKKPITVLICAVALPSRIPDTTSTMESFIGLLFNTPVNTPDAKTIIITPWEKPLIKEIEKAIMNSEVGITPENNGEIIRLGIPPLTEERRRALAKQSKQEAETAKISIRNARRDAIESIKKSVKADGTPEDVAKDAEAEVQKIHDRFIKKVDDLYAAKEKEIMTV